jgi:hypothetical protein
MVSLPRSPRSPTTLRALYDDGQVRLSGPVRDMSTSGLFVETEVGLAVGRRVAVVPLLEELEGLRLPAEVVRVASGKGVAVRFLDLDLDSRQRLRAVLFKSRYQDRRPARRPSPVRTSPPPSLLPPDAPVLLLAEEEEIAPRRPTVPGVRPARGPAPTARIATPSDEARARHVKMLLDENSKLKRRIHELEEALEEEEKMQRFLFQRLHEIESKSRGR